MVMGSPYNRVSKVFGTVLLELAQADERVAVFDADLSRATETAEFKKTYPERYFDVGIAEANMVSMAAGYALCGRIAVCGTFATFITRRVYDQVAVSCALNRANVRLIGIEAGLSSGRNGATHQSVDDLAIMRACPNMAVVDPSDATEVRQILHESLAYEGPVYLRMLRGESPVIFDPQASASPWGKAKHVRKGTDVTVVTTGIMLERALAAVEILSGKGTDVDLLHMPYVKPFDALALVDSVCRTGRAVTAENHSVVGGLGGAVAEALAQSRPAPLERVGIADTFGECGEADALSQRYGLSPSAIVEAVERAMGRARASR
jgi:transketolase